MKKKISLFLVFMLMLTMIPQIAIEALAAEIIPKAIVDSGKCGENLTWELDVEGTLTISGFGDMYDKPDIGSKDSIKRIKLKEGITSIGDEAFKKCNNLTDNLIIPEGVISIGDCAFYECSGLTD